MEYEIVAHLQGAVFLFFILIRGVMELLLGIDLLVGGEKMERVASYLVVGTVYLSSCMLMLFLLKSILISLSLRKIVPPITGALNLSLKSFM